MNTLNKEKCVACRVEAPKVEGAEIDDLLIQIPEWHLVEIDNVPRLTRQYKFKNFVEAIAFTNKVGEIAEAEDHHPAILTEWGSVQVSWWTHKIKGLHRNDFVMAAKTDSINST
ncbi:MAG: 4a-hydroxytetrahydrobiopterin dehydratase [Gammaproteobacteria bacterium]|jgi:4a-hydroxytetrahydrobiopterin dehydratase